MSIRFGNAPCSWGTIEGFGEGVPYPRMLDELVKAGYGGTELGDYGFMPTDPERLRAELAGRGLSMLGAYEGVYLKDRASYGDGEARVLRVARLLKAVADVNTESSNGADWQPLLVLADEHSRDLPRVQRAGSIGPEHALNDADWRIFADGAERLARAVRDETGLRTVFHHHCGGYVETPDEIARFLSLTDPGLVGLVFDTGHYLYGSGGSDPQTVTAGLERFMDRVWYVHFKDMQPEVAARSRRSGLTYQQAVGEGVFCELGRGAVPFAAVLGQLREAGYGGWVTVEQDVLPGMGEPFLSARANRDYLAGIDHEATSA
jgi:inosose dehydratase